MKYDPAVIRPASVNSLWRFVECAVANRDSLATFRALRELRRMEKDEKQKGEPK